MFIQKWTKKIVVFSPLNPVSWLDSFSTLSGDKEMDDDEDYLLFTAIANWFIGGSRDFYSSKEATSTSSAARSPSSPRSQRVILVLLPPPLLLLYCCLKQRFRTF